MTGPTEAITQAQRGNIRAAENAMMNALEQPEVVIEQWTPVLELIAKASQDDAGETLAWAALDAIQERMDLKEAIPHCGNILRLFSRNDEIRARAVELYQQAYQDVPNLDTLIDISSLAGGKPIRRALQTLDLCLAIGPGSYLAHKHDGAAAKVISIEQPNWNIRLQTPSGEELFDAVTLGDQYELADPCDIRVLRQFDPERLDNMLKSQPGDVVLATVKQHGNEITTDELERLLCPRFISKDDWSKWWSKARAALKKNSRVRLEGRNPVTIRYEIKDISIEDEIRAKFNLHDPPKTWLDLAKEYLRECKNKSRQPRLDFLIKMRDAAKTEAAGLSERKDAQALPAWLTIGEITRLAGEECNDADAIRILNQAGSLRDALFEFSDSYWPMVLATIKKGRPETWLEDYAALLPITPPSYCDDLADQIYNSGNEHLLSELVPTILADPISHFKGLCWLYQDPRQAAALDLPPLITLLSRLLDALDQINHSATLPAELAKDLRARARNTLCYKKHQRFKECLEQINEDMSNALRTRIQRAMGLSKAVKSDLANLINRRFPSISSRPQIPPWEDTSVLYCTGAGMNAKEAQLKELVNVKLKENAAAIAAAAAHGDLSENSEYKFALEERDLLRSRIAEIQNQLAIAQVVYQNEAPHDYVGIGSRTTFKNLTSGEVFHLTFLGPWEADMDMNILNYQAPISQRAMGLKVGESLEFEFGPHSGRFEVVSIEPGIE